jgi:hypothetical protein
MDASAIVICFLEYGEPPACRCTLAIIDFPQIRQSSFACQSKVECRFVPRLAFGCKHIVARSAAGFGLGHIRSQAFTLPLNPQAGNSSPRGKDSQAARKFRRSVLTLPLLCGKLTAEG